MLIFSRQDLEDLPGDDRRKQAEKASRGGYVIVGAENPDVMLVGNGSDVSLLVHAAEELAKDGVKAGVVSVPSLGLFAAQDKEYRDSVLPDGVRIFGLTSGLPATLYPVMKGDWKVVGMERFGASAPAKVLEDKFGYTVPAVVAEVKAFLGK